MTTGMRVAVAARYFSERTSATSGSCFGVTAARNSGSAIALHDAERGRELKDKGLGFGGKPIFYGNFAKAFRETKDHEGNPFWYQGLLFNEFYSALDGKQQEKILVAREPRNEKPSEVIAKRKTDLPGLCGADLSKDQQAKCHVQPSPANLCRAAIVYRVLTVSQQSFMILHTHKAMRLFILIAIIVTFATSLPAADSPDAKFPIVGETYRIATAAPLAETPFDNIVTIVSVGEHQWAKVQFEKMTREGKEKREMWVNFAQVTSAVKSAAGK